MASAGLSRIVGTLQLAFAFGLRLAQVITECFVSGFEVSMYHFSGIGDVGLLLSFCSGLMLAFGVGNDNGHPWTVVAVNVMALLHFASLRAFWYAKAYVDGLVFPGGTLHPGDFNPLVWMAEVLLSMAAVALSLWRVILS